MKTKIYISLSILLYTTLLSLVHINTDSVYKFIGISALSLILYIFFEILLKLMIALIDDNPSYFDYYSIGFSPILFFFKPIYYNGLKNLYIFRRGTKYYIFNCGYFFLKEVCTVKGIGDIDKDIEKVKSEIEKSFKEKLCEEKFKNKYKRWDGSVDTYSRREHSVDELLK